MEEQIMFRSLSLFLIIMISLVAGSGVVDAAKTLEPGFITVDDLDAEPELVTVNSYGTDSIDPNTFRQAIPEEVLVEVYELQPGLYYFINDPAGETDPEMLNLDTGEFYLSNTVGDSGADGVMFRGMGSYPGATAISFGLPREYPALPRLDDGSIDIEEAAVTVGYKFFKGQRNFAVDVIGVFENVAIGDHASNNRGVLHTFGGGRLFCTDVWVYNVYDGVFFDNIGEAYFVNCILHQTYQPWNHIDDATEAGYFTEDWDTWIAPRRNEGVPEFVDYLGLDPAEYPELRGIQIGNDTFAGWNINLIETEGADPQLVCLKGCTVVRHQVRDSNRTWRHNAGSGTGAYVLIEDCMLLSVDLSPSTAVRIDTDDDDFLGFIYNTKVWNYASDSATLEGMDYGNWNDGGFYSGDPLSLEEYNIDLDTPGGLDVSDVSELFQLDGRNLTTFRADAIELTMASDGRQIGYRLPDTAPEGPLPVTEGTITPVADWPLH